MPAPDILGDRQSGQDVRTQNVMASQAVADPVRPDKMLVDDIGDVTIMNDCATIMKMLEEIHPDAKIWVDDIGDVTITNDGKLLEVEHPPAKMLVDDIGDVTITNDAATILKMLEEMHPGAKKMLEVEHSAAKEANELVRNNIHVDVYHT